MLGNVTFGFDEHVHILERYCKGDHRHLQNLNGSLSKIKGLISCSDIYYTYILLACIPAPVGGL